MQYNFNESSMIVGQIKELLHSFNLPNVQVWTDNIEEPFKGRTYIKDGKIKKYTSSGWVTLDDYLYDREIANFTKTLAINSSIYDNYTHEYLGEYLRFIRDYHHVNLMQLYNCFGNRRPSRIYKKLSSGSYTITINTDDAGYNYYIVPVKFNQVYTIGIESNAKYDICCLLYDSNFVSNTPDDLITQSYKSVSGSKFTKPFLYNTNFDCAKNCWRNERDLVLLIKLPSEVETSITILEGNYQQFCNVIDGTLITKFNEFDTEFESENDSDSYQEDYASKLSLLEVNNKKSYPFADRLIEFILGNMITPLDTIDTNIERVQDIIYESGIKGDYGIWDNCLRNNIYKEVNEKDLTKGSNNKYGNIITVGTSIKKGIITGTDYQDPKRSIDLYKDITGYVDKDTETILEVNDNE